MSSEFPLNILDALARKRGKLPNLLSLLVCGQPMHDVRINLPSGCLCPDRDAAVSVLEQAKKEDASVGLWISANPPADRVVRYPSTMLEILDPNPSPFPRRRLKCTGTTDEGSMPRSTTIPARAGSG